MFASRWNPHGASLQLCCTIYRRTQTEHCTVWKADHNQRDIGFRQMPKRPHHSDPPSGNHRREHSLPEANVTDHHPPRAPWKHMVSYRVETIKRARHELP